MYVCDCMRGGGTSRREGGRERQSERKEVERNSVVFKWESRAQRGKETQSEKREREREGEQTKKE